MHRIRDSPMCPVQESDIRGLVLDTVSKFYHNIRDGR